MKIRSWGTNILLQFKIMDEDLGFVELASITPWPKLEDGKVPTKEFLEASQVIIKFFDSLGKIYLPVKQDIQGNINKLTSKYSENRDKYKYFQDMIQYEVDTGQSVATESLLWLKRGLYYICLLLQRLVNDYFVNDDHSESLLPNLHHGYDLSLRPYHNWALQKLYQILSRAAPSRSTLLTTMAQTDPNKISQAELMSRMKTYVAGLKLNLSSIFDFYNQLNLDDCVFVCY